MATYVEEEAGINEIDNFKPIFKKYKRKDRPLDVTDVIDFDNDKNLDKVKNFPLVYQNEPFPGMRPVSDWKAYMLKSHSGFIFIVNPFKSGYQRYWVSRCMKDYPCRPSVRNLDAYMKVEDHINIWDNSVTTERDNITCKECLMMKLRWVTMGYHYDWNTKKYYKDRHAPFAADMSQLGKHVAAAIGFPKFSPEAAVLNYYHLDSALSGHTDHSEFDHSAPLISFSFGQDCIFLIGGETKETEPSAVFLRSGDICIMSGEARLVYHAVPRIMPASQKKMCDSFDISGVPKQEELTTEPDSYNTLHRDMLQKIHCDCDDWELMAEYLSQTRINFNIRQVLQPNREFPVES